MADENTPFSRWAAWEKQVLAKVDQPNKCRQTIRQRQDAFNDDASEAELVVAQFREELRRRGHDPQKDCVFIPSVMAADWLRIATRVGRPTNKASSLLRDLRIAEMSKSKKDGVPGWRWLGPDADPNATMKRLQQVAPLTKERGTKTNESTG